MTIEAVIIYLGNSRMTIQKPCYLHGVMAVPFHSYLQCFHSVNQKEGIEGAAAASNHLEYFVNMIIHEFQVPPQENSANGRSMAIQEFRSGMNDENQTKPEWLLKIRSGKGIIAGNQFSILFA